MVIEKKSPHYSLAEMQVQVAADGAAAFTATALHGGWSMGLTSAEVLAVVAALKRRDFYKSMTTYRDHRVWQDVYHGRCPNGLTAYIKLTRVAERVVIQFKEQ